MLRAGTVRKKGLCPPFFEREVFFRERSNFHLGTEKVHEQR
jgi:hypothetical protein